MTPYILAEIAAAHIGDTKTCHDLTVAAYKAGADGVKYQIWSLADIKGHKYFNNMKRFKLDKEQWREITENAKILGLDVWIECYSKKTYQFAETLGPDFFKMPYTLFLNNPTVADTDIPIFWRVQNDLPIYGKHVAIGEQSFPTSWEQARDELELLSNFPDCDILYADHQNTYGLTDDYGQISLAAHNAGAQYIEKHICMDREALKKESKDYVSALEPDEFKDYVEFMHSQNGKLGVIV